MMVPMYGMRQPAERQIPGKYGHAMAEIREFGSIAEIAVR
jgi:hypothetical protein